MARFVAVDDRGEPAARRGQGSCGIARKLPRIYDRNVVHVTEGPGPEQRRTGAAPADHATGTPTSRLDGHALHHLQRTAGNAAVARRLAVQRHEGPSIPPGAPPIQSGSIEPWGGATAGPASGVTEARQWSDIRSVLTQTESGQWALRKKRRHNPTLILTYAGPGGYHQSGTIRIQSNYPRLTAAHVFIHEMQHATTFFEGRAADVTSLSRSEYVRRKIEDEVQAVLRQIDMVDQYQAPREDGTTRDFPRSQLPTVYREYHRAYNRYLESHPDQEEPARATGARTAGRRRVRRAFSDGTVTTSTSGGTMSYSDHYGNYWDSQHPAPPAGGAAAGPVGGGGAGGR